MTITINIPVKQSKKLKHVDIEALFRDFAEEYLEDEEDKKLRKAIMSDQKMLKLGRDISKLL
jgi:hypothetical protein